jgi:quercetin dioxygenase-like cupin family protein
MSASEAIAVGPVRVRFLLTGRETNGSLAMFELTVPAGKALPAPAHFHDHYEESGYGLEGTLTFTIDGIETPVGPGEAFSIPRGAAHRFDNLGPVDAKVLCAISPAEIGPEYFREVGAALEAAGDGPPDKARMAEIKRRHGLGPAPPRS